MTTTSSPNEFDVIVIGSGMGGMTTAAALSRFEHRVLLLEKGETIGGLTHSFSRNGFSWDVGLHYCGTFRHGQFAGRILNWLSGGAIEFRSTGTVYDILHFPDRFELSVGRPADAYKMELKEKFPGHTAEIDAYFEALLSAEETSHMLGAERAMPHSLRSAHFWWHARRIKRWCGRTTAEVVNSLVSDPKLAAVLTAQWPDYGGKPTEASFAIHALIMGHYLEGAAYPVGGAASIARGLVPVIEEAGGSAQAGTPVQEILFEDGRAVGVRTGAGEIFRAPAIVSAMGASETVKRLLPEDIRAQDWAQEILSFRPSLCHFEVYLGFEGDITRYGATRSNHWFHESWDTNDAIWTVRDNAPIPAMFVSFASLKDAAHDPGPKSRHVGSIAVFTDWSAVADFVNPDAERRPSEWSAFKADIESRMMALFAEKFPALAPLIVHHELGTPLATVAFTDHEKAGFYGVETTPRRMLSDALSARTPVPGLYLSGQDVMSPGIAGAFAGGLFGAAAIDLRVLQKLR